MSAQCNKLRVALVSSLMSVAAGAAVAADTGLTPADRAFVGKAAQGGQFEVAAGKLATQRALSPAVKAFAQKMVSDHSAANDLLKSVADAKQMPLPDSMTVADQAALGKLEGLNGTDFDKTYADMMVKDHTADVGEFQREATKAVDPDVKSFVQETLPTLQHHLMMANQLSVNANRSPSVHPSTAPAQSPESHD